MNVKGIWLTWEIQRRNKGISAALKWPLYEITFSGSRFKRYLYSSLATIRIIKTEKPQVVVAQNPSIVLALLVVLLGWLFKYRTVIDAHNSGICPLEGKSKFLMLVAKWLQCNADLTIVTNDQLRSTVESNGGKAIVMPDMLPEAPPTRANPLSGRFNLAYICTYSKDEPYKEVVKAAANLPKDVHIHITGRYNGKIDENNVPENVKLLGFISDEQYWDLLSSVDVIIDLTLRENCLVCGAYEAVSKGKPLILSDTKALRNYFSKGCVYVQPDSDSIYNGIICALDQKDK